MSEALRYRTLVVPTDFSPTAHRALELARTLALGAGPAEVVLAHARFVPREIEAVLLRGPQKILDELEQAARTELDALVAELGGAGVKARFVTREGRPERVILEVARQENADLIVMGTHGRRGVTHMLLGSVAERLLREAPCPVATVGPTSRSAAAMLASGG